MSIHKILKIVGLVISLIGVYFLANILLKGDDAIIESGSGIDGFLYTAYFIFGLVVLAVVVFGLKALFTGNVKNTLIILGAFLAVVAVSYGMADGTPMMLTDGEMLSESGSKWVGAGLYTFYLLGAIAIVSMIISGFKKVK
jgi:peptidoglycan/LPS O-acetylase OafA/YrhL